MSKFICVEPQAGAPGAMSDTGTKQLWPLGYVARAEDKQTGASSLYCGAGEFMYCAGSNVTAIGQFVMVEQSPAGNTALLLASANSASKFPCGVAAGNLSATSVFGWVQIEGLCDYARGTNSSIAAGVTLYFAATAGLLITNVGAGSQVAGVVCPVSYTSSQSASLTVQLARPYIPGVTASQ
jgi:hypothetical protein